MDDRGDHARQRSPQPGVDALVARQQARDAVLESSGEREALAAVGLGRVPEDELVEIRASVLDVLPQALHDGTDECDGALERAALGGSARRPRARPSSMAAANFWFCTMISSSAFVAAYRYSVPIATSARSAICCVVTL